MYKTILIVFASLIAGALLFSAAFANGGNQKVVAGKYVVQLSMAPLVPRAGEVTSMIVSIADLKVAPLQEKVFLKVSIRPRGSSEALFDSGEREILGGNFDFSYKFPRKGLYEVFVEFRRAVEPDVIYRPEDFLIAVEQKPFPVFAAVMASLLFGLLLGLSLGLRKRFTVSPVSSNLTI